MQGPLTPPSSRPAGGAGQMNRSSIVQLEKWGSGMGMGGKPHRERTWKKPGGITVKCQWITPSSSVNLGTLRVGMADAASSDAASHQCLPIFLHSPPPQGTSSLPPCHFQISSLHPHLPWSLLTSFLPLVWSTCSQSLSQHTAAKFIFSK